MRTVVKIVVMAGGSSWDHITITCDTVISSRNDISLFQLKSEVQEKNCIGYTVAGCDKHCGSEWDEDEVIINHQYQQEKEKSYLSFEHVNLETKNFQCFKQHLLYRSDITQGNNIGNTSKDLNASKTLDTKFSPHYETEGLNFEVFLRELQTSKIYRQLVLQNLTKCHPNHSQNGTRKTLIILWKLKDTIPYVIDYKWCILMNRCAQERQHLDTSMSWLSTLGGACSALGDYKSSFALRAGAISLEQLEIAMRLGDPGIISRCRLYAAISFIQQCKFRVSAVLYNFLYVL